MAKRNSNEAGISPIASRWSEDEGKRTKLAEQLGAIDLSPLQNDPAIPDYAKGLFQQLGGLLQAAVELLGAQPTVNQQIEEERRKHELVIALLPESKESLPSNRVKNDISQVNSMLDTLQIEMAPVAVYRMGRPPTDGFSKPRLLKVQMPTRTSTQTFVRKSYLLKALFPGIRVRESKSKEERDAYKLLVQQCSTMRRESGKDYIIYAGTIVDRETLPSNRN